MPALDISALRKAVAQNRYFISTHAKHAWASGKSQKRRGARRARGPSTGLLDTGARWELLDEIASGDHALDILVICAFDGTFAHIITVYWYDPSVWIDPWTRRKE